MRSNTCKTSCRWYNERMNRARAGLAAVLIGIYLLCGVGHVAFEPPPIHAHTSHHSDSTYQDHFVQMTGVILEQLSLLFVLAAVLVFCYLAGVPKRPQHFVPARFTIAHTHAPPFQFWLLQKIVSPPQH